MDYDVIIIGGGLSGLTAASLLAKRKLHVAVIEQAYMPGGSCGIFKRGDTVFDIGAAMLYGFGEAGFNIHRFVFDCLEESIDVIAHDELYCVNYQGRRIVFYPDIDRFTDELIQVFPEEAAGIKRFYADMSRMYRYVMVENPAYASADETAANIALKSMIRHPLSYVRFLGMLNRSAKSLLERYFTNPGIFNFFDKLTSTYCYATVEEAPAVLAAVMFVDNHLGGSYYPAGSTLFLPGKLEKVIEENGGQMIYQRRVESIVFHEGKPRAVKLDDGRVLCAKDIVYSGTVWNLYGKLIDPIYTTDKRRQWAERQLPTHPSVVLYTRVDKSVIPQGTRPIEMLVGNPRELDESEITAYILSIDDRSLCADDEHTVTAIGPSFVNWFGLDHDTYKERKKNEVKRLLDVLERRFPGFSAAVRYCELATPQTIERFTLKNGGSVAGPKQMLGQHMFHRQHIRTAWDNLFCCGESTVMGTGTPTVTTSGLSAANAILAKRGLDRYVYDPKRPKYVNIVEKPYTKERLFAGREPRMKEVMTAALRCRFCEYEYCSKKEVTDVRGIMRRVSVGNFVGAKRRWDETRVDIDTLLRYENSCIQNKESSQPVEIVKVFSYLDEVSHE